MVSRGIPVVPSGIPMLTLWYPVVSRIHGIPYPWYPIHGIPWYPNHGILAMVPYPWYPIHGVPSLAFHQCYPIYGILSMVFHPCCPIYANSSNSFEQHRRVVSYQACVVSGWGLVQAFCVIE